MFRLMYVLLTVVATAAIAAGLAGMAVAFHKPIVRTTSVQVPEPKLTASSTAADAKAREGAPAQTIDGQQIGLPAGTACAVYELKDGVKLICYQGGAA